MSATFFRVEIRDGTEVFVGNDAARGPWDPTSCHAGPPTALVARACEQVVAGVDADRNGGGRLLVRLTVDLARPIPIDGFTISATVDRAGRTTAASSAVLADLEGGVRVQAFGLHLQPSDDHPYPSPGQATPDLADSEPGGFPIQRMGHGLPGFSSGVEMRYPPGQDRKPGPTTAWMRTIPVLPDEEPSGFQRICALADSGNAIGRNAEPDEIAFVNPDLTITLHREPDGEWFGSEVISHWQPNGIGLADALLFDHLGPVGRAVQTILLRKQV
ncbi:MAG: thioesterase family protein [Acidimicrobiia bacterium]|nr:thioesterase family protein [Acidimicrobiia bacterium]